MRALHTMSYVEFCCTSHFSACKQAELDEEAARAEQADRELNEREREALAGGVSPEGQPDDEAQGPGAMRSISMLQKCRGVECFEKIRRISEGTYGVVYQ